MDDKAIKLSMKKLISLGKTLLNFCNEFTISDNGLIMMVSDVDGIRRLGEIKSESDIELLRPFKHFLFNIRNFREVANNYKSSTSTVEWIEKDDTTVINVIDKDGNKYGDVHELFETSVVPLFAELYFNSKGEILPDLEDNERFKVSDEDITAILDKEDVILTLKLEDKDSSISINRSMFPKLNKCDSFTYGIIDRDIENEVCTMKFIQDIDGMFIHTYIKYIDY